MARKGPDFAAQDAEILAALDIMAEYAAMGVRFTAGEPRASGKIACFAVGREDRRASAYVDVNTGRYGDSATGESLSLWDFAVRHGNLGVPDWQAARKHFASKAGVKIGRSKPEDRPEDKLRMLPWTSGLETMATVWCESHKAGTSLGAIKLAGGQVAAFPRYRDKKTGEWRDGRLRVIAMPAWGPRLLEGGPVAYVLWRLDGQHFEIPRGKGNEPDLVKMRSCGPTRGTLMNLHALRILADPEARQQVKLVWKAAGPADMLALQTAILADPEAATLLDTHLVIANASTETGDVEPFTAELLAGLPAGAIHDADKAGTAGLEKWRHAIGPAVAELRLMRPPGEVREKRGIDARDLLVGGPETPEPPARRSIA